MKKILMLALATLVATQTLYAYKLNNVALNGARWRNYPVSMSLNTANSGLADQEVTAAIQAEMSKWNEVAGFEVLKVSGTTTTPAANAMDVDGMNMIAFSTNFRTDSNGFDPQSAVAIAGQYGDGYAMTDAFLLFNAEYVAWDTDSAKSTSKRSYRDHLPTIALHELGHVLGLGHSDVASAVMAAARQSKIMVTLTDDDIAAGRYVTGAANAAEYGSGQSNSQNNGGSSLSGGCGTITNSGGSNGGNISGNAAIMLLPLLALLLIRRKAISFSRQ
jgi:Matrixin